MSTLHSTTILIVDDNIGARRSIEGLLASEGYNLISAESGIEALKIAEETRPDLVLLDVMMPGMNGFEVCSRIRDTTTLTEIPVIMITALDDDESVIKGIDAGADDFLTKPINRLELRSRVRGISRLNRYRKLCGERQKFEWVVENSVFGYLILDEEGSIVFSNSKAKEILKLSENSANEGISFIQAAEDLYQFRPNRIRENWAEKSETIEADPFLLVQPQTTDGFARWIKTTVLNLDLSNRQQRLIRLEDITQSMLSFQEKHTFSRIISHKLLTPLNALKAANQMMATVNNATDGKELLKRISNLQQRGIDRLEYDMESVIRFLDSNSANKDPEPSSLLALSTLLREIGEETRIPFSLATDLGNSKEWVANISLYNFESCVREIFENAVKFHPTSTPSVDCSIHFLDASDQVAFTFENDGEAITEEELENAWKPYWQADRFFTGEIRGMGLGLALVATNIWAAGGNCALKNREDRPGAVITLTLPAFHPQSTENPPIDTKEISV